MLFIIKFEGYHGHEPNPSRLVHDAVVGDAFDEESDLGRQDEIVLHLWLV